MSQTGYIYQLRIRGTQTIFYVGSTKNIRDRRYAHKTRTSNVNAKQYNSPVYQFIRNNGGWEKIIMEQLEEVTFNTRKELNRMEGEKIQEFIGKGYDMKNKLIAGRTQKEWSNDNHGTVLKNKKQYRIRNSKKLVEKQQNYYGNNRDKILEKHNTKHECECGGRYTYAHKSEHLKSKKHQNFINNK